MLDFGIVVDEVLDVTHRGLRDVGVLLDEKIARQSEIPNFLVGFDLLKEVSPSAARRLAPTQVYLLDIYLWLHQVLGEAFD